MADTEKTTERAARDIVGMMGYKALFEYMPEMEISVPDSDKRNSLDKIAYYYRNEEIVLSDLYIGYVIALYKYTIPKVVGGGVVGVLVLGVGVGAGFGVVVFLSLI